MIQAQPAGAQRVARASQKPRADIGYYLGRKEKQ
jgi:hypothetical protein